MNVPGTAGADVAGNPVTAWRNAVMAAFALGGVTVSTWGPRLAELRADLGVGDATIGLVLAGVTVGSIAGLTASAAVLGWLGARRAVCGMLWLVAVGVAVIGLGAGAAHSVPATAVGFVCVGFGIGAADVMINVEGAGVERAAGRTLMPLMHAAWSAGAIAGAGIGAACAALEVPVEGQFVGEAVLIAVVAAVAVRFLPPTTEAPDRSDRPPVAARVRAWLGGWGNVQLLLIGLVMLGVELGEGAANSWLTLAVRDGHGRPDAVAALFFVAFAVGETLARVVGGPLVDRIGRVRAVRLTTAVGAVGVGLFIVSTPRLADPARDAVVGRRGVDGLPAGDVGGGRERTGPRRPGECRRLDRVPGEPRRAAVHRLLSETVGLLNALWLVAVLLAVGFAGSGALRTRRAGSR